MTMEIYSKDSVYTVIVVCTSMNVWNMKDTYVSYVNVWNKLSHVVTNKYSNTFSSHLNFSRSDLKIACASCDESKTNATNEKLSDSKLIAFTKLSFYYLSKRLTLDFGISALYSMLLLLRHIRDTFCSYFVPGFEMTIMWQYNALKISVALIGCL